MSDNKLNHTTGVDNFRKLREEGYYYIDKSIMIQDFLSYRDEVSLITRPRRFGKTLNMTMLRDFFDINQKSEGIFSGLAIIDTEYVNHMNSRPVIYLTFKGCSGDDLEQLKVSLATEIKEKYFKYEELISESKKVDWESNRYYEFYQIYLTFKGLVATENENSKFINNLTLKRSLFVLTRTLANFYNQRPLLLIDEYDQPLINAHKKGFREAFSVDIYADFLGDALKGNSYLHQALLTGIQRIAKESIFSKLNNFSVYGVHSKRYSQYFGFTEEETKKALEDYSFSHSEEVRNYYDGYRIGGYDIYNPWSIASYLKEGELDSYWINTSTNLLIRELIIGASHEFHEAFEELIVDGEVEMYVNLEASFIELATPATLWGLLVNAGYLTIIEKFGGRNYLLRIPNREVKEEFRSIVELYIGASGDRLNSIFDALTHVNMERFLKLYQKFVYDIVSFHDVQRIKPENKKPYHLENSYHMLFLGMASSVEGMYTLTSNLETGDARLTKVKRNVEPLVETDSHNFSAKNEQYRSHDGRSDVILESLQPDLRPHVIVEFEMGEDVGMLKQKGLDQIFEQRYYKKLKGKVLCVGIAHNMKRCELAHKEIFIDDNGEIL